MPERVGVRGQCDLYERHDAHIFPTGIIDNAGNTVMHDCSGQYSDCSNCDDRKCMDCVLRYVHDRCQDDCPMCCGVPLPPDARIGENDG